MFSTAIGCCRLWRIKILPPEALSDCVRVALLARYGGVWVDSTCYCLRPLDEWLYERLPNGFFAFARPGGERLLSSWFLAAAANNHIIERWRELALKYWNHRSVRDDYFWFHHLFAAGYGEGSQFRAIWDAVPAISADGPHHYLPYENQAPGAGFIRRSPSGGQCVGAAPQADPQIGEHRTSRSFGRAVPYRTGGSLVCARRPSPACCAGYAGGRASSSSSRQSAAARRRRSARSGASTDSQACTRRAPPGRPRPSAARAERSRLERTRNGRARQSKIYISCRWRRRKTSLPSVALPPSS